MNSYTCCAKQTKEHTQILKQLSLIKILSDQNRLKILCILNNTHHTVEELTRHLQVSQSLTSHHLISLKKHSLVSADKNGRNVTYTLTNKGKHAVALLTLLSKENI